MTENNTHKADFVNIIGNPNVGKSTLMNRYQQLINKFRTIDQNALKNY